MSKAEKRKTESSNCSSKAAASVIVEFENKDSRGYDDSNALVVIPKKKKKDEKPIKIKKRLTKKERKRLTDIIKRKEGKDRRAELLESLAKHQASEEEMKNFTSITEVYSQNFKSEPSVGDTFEMKVNTIKGSKKKKGRTSKLEEPVEESTDTDDMSTDEEVADNIRTLTKADEGSENKEVEESTGKEEEMETSEEASGSVAKGDNEAQQTENAKEKQMKADKVYPHVIGKPATFIGINRDEKIQEARLKLPILAEEQVIMETINENPVVIISGETGSGKTTQVPQFLYEAGYAHDKGIIGVTEPRRVAAISMSRRVATEMNLTSKEVSYQIRFEGNVTPNTKIKFLTDGVLLKEAQNDPLLTKYSVIIIDEAHERSVYTDILIGLLSIIVRQREKRGRPLKLVIMSATLRVEDFMSPKLFRSKEPPPLIKVDARQFPVTVHFNKQTNENYVTEVFKKVCKIHRTLPDGGILIFVTGQQEVHTLVRKLRRLFPYTHGKAMESIENKKLRRERKKKTANEDKEIEQAPKIDLNSYSVVPQDEEAERENNYSDENNEDSEEDDIEEEAMRLKMNENGPDTAMPLYVLPLYSLLSSDKQSKVFDPPPDGCRLCVVATNVAETSLTIPNVRYVVDSGKTKTKFFDKVTGVSTFRVTWVSQASADQRAGRAGRMGPGHCYRLYSSAVFNDFTKFSPPEISRRPVEDLVLQMKSMRIDKVANFPFPSPPDAEQIKAAETLLISLGALRRLSVGKRFKDIKNEKSPVITDVGSTMSSFPVSPRYAKMLLLGRQYNVLQYVIALVAALSVEEIFENSIQPSDVEDNKERYKVKAAQMNIFKSKLVGNALLLGDMMVLLTAVGACEAEGGSISFCAQLGIRLKAMREIRRLRVQLTNAANVAFQTDSLVVDPNLSPPNEDQVQAIRKVVFGGLADHVARKNAGPVLGMDKEEAKKLKGSFECMQLEELVYIHPESILFRNSEIEFVVYQSIMETSRLHMRGLCCVEPQWFPELAPSYCVMSKVLENPPPKYDSSKGKVTCHQAGSFGRCNWEFPAVEVDFPDSVECFRWFAKFLLEGEIIPALKPFSSSLLLSPSTMVKSWAKLQPKTESMLKALLAAGTNSKQSLLRAWKNNAQFLQREYLEWLKESEHHKLLAAWPKITSSGSL